MMKPWNNIKRRIEDNKVDRLYSKAITVSSKELAPKVLTELGRGMIDYEDTIYSPTVTTGKLFDHVKPVSRKLSRYIKEKRKTTRKTLSNVTIVQSPYSYDRIDSFYNRESYFSRSLIRQVETMMRNGYEFASEDRPMLKITKQEFTRIAMDSGMPTDQFIFSVAMNLLKYGIAIVHKVRERVKDDVALDNKRKNRITRLRVIKPHNAFLYLNDKGKIVGVYDSSTNILSQVMQKLVPAKTFTGITADDIMILYITDPGEDIFPVPPCFQMLDDVLTLRSIEETVELLTFQFGSPLLLQSCLIELHSYFQFSHIIKQVLFCMRTICSSYKIRNQIQVHRAGNSVGQVCTVICQGIIYTFSSVSVCCIAFSY